MSRRVFTLVCALALCGATSAAAQTTALFFDSQPGDWVGAGMQRTWFEGELTFSVWTATASRVTLRADNFGSGSSTWWDLEFKAPQGGVLAPGTFDYATRSAFTPPLLPGLSVTGSGRGCNRSTGRFVIHEIVFDSGGTLTRFAADFEQHCENGIPALFGAIRYRSSRPALVPFDGVYPLYTLTILPPVNGSISAGGINCGASGLDCDEVYPAGGPKSLTALPSPGYVFAGWTGDCYGSSTTSVTVFGQQRCSAVFDRAPGAGGLLPDELGAGSLLFFSQRGDYIGQAQRHVWTLTDTTFTGVASSGPPVGRTVSFRTDGPEGLWNLDFVAPAGQVLQPGDYVGATRHPFQAASVPGLNVSGEGRGCNTLTGRFRIYEVHVDSTGKADKFAADFEQHCEGQTPALFGAIRFNSSRPSLMPFDGTFLPATALTLETPVNGSRVGRPFTIGGYALNTGDAAGTGVDFVHAYAFRDGAGTPIFLGAASYGGARPDVGAVFGAPFTNSGFSLSAGQNLGPGTYLVAVIAHDTVTGTSAAVKTTSITIPAADPRVTIEAPADGAAVGGTFDVSGWAIDTATPTGAGIDAVHVYAFRDGDPAPIFLGAATYGSARPDIGAIFGSQFSPSGYRLTVTGVAALTPGSYTLYVFARSTLNGQFYGAARRFTKVPGGAMSVDLPGNGAHVSGSFLVAGWAIDTDASSGTGVDAVHVWAFPSSGGSPIFAGAAALGAARSDIAAIYGARFLASGFNLSASALPPGTYTIAVCARSVFTGTFSQIRTITIVVD